MAKKSAKNPGKVPAKMPGAGFNTPFRNLPAPPPPARPAPLPKPAVKAPPPIPPEDDQRAFERAMRGVTPLGASNRRRVVIDPGPRPAASPSRSAASDDALAEAELADLIESANALSVEEVGESVTALAPGIDRRLLKRLRAGQYAVEGELDLHHLTRPEAEAGLTRFVARMRAEGKRCVLIIHGRGHNSGADGAVLRGAVRVFLAQGPLRRYLLAFTSAPPTLGGDGALLALLRRKS